MTARVRTLLAIRQLLHRLPFSNYQGPGTAMLHALRRHSSVFLPLGSRSPDGTALLAGGLTEEEILAFQAKLANGVHGH